LLPLQFFTLFKAYVTRPSILLPFSFYLISRKPYRLKRVVVVSRKQFKALQAFNFSVGVKWDFPLFWNSGSYWYQPGFSWCRGSYRTEPFPEVIPSSPDRQGG